MGGTVQGEDLTVGEEEEEAVGVTVGEVGENGTGGDSGGWGDVLVEVAGVE